MAEFIKVFKAELIKISIFLLLFSLGIIYSSSNAPKGTEGLVNHLIRLVNF